jgi:hypothetical protein
MIRLRRITLVALLLAISCAGNPPPTPVANLADTATKIQQSANVILHATQAANSTVVPSTGKPLVSRQVLDDVALQVNKIGRLGLGLRAALDDYNRVKAAGKDPTAQRIAIQQALADLTTSLNVVGAAVPKGIVADVDQAVTAILGFIAQIKGGVGL